MFAMMKHTKLVLRWDTRGGEGYNQFTSSGLSLYTILGNPAAVQEQLQQRHRGQVKQSRAKVEHYCNQGNIIITATSFIGLDVIDLAVK